MIGQFFTMGGRKKLNQATATILLGIFIFSLLSLAYSDAQAAVPRILAFQGRLTNGSGSLLGGAAGTNYYFKFAIYNATSGGTKLWPSGTIPTITSKVTQGVFNVLLGDTSAGFSALDIDFDSQNYYLEVQVSEDNNTFETLTPRQRIVASGFAIKLRLIC